MSYNDIKKHAGQVYTGASIGFTHEWNYTDTHVIEKKIAPNKWTFTRNCIKKPVRFSGGNKGAQEGTEYHWLLIGEQKVKKNKDGSYAVIESNTKYKLGHKRPHWKAFSYCYPEQKSEYQQRLAALTEELDTLKNKQKQLEKR